MREFETEVFDTAGTALTLWWYKINPHRSYVKGWKIAPSHYLNQSLDQIWLDK
jgi:peptide/nickel transport system substrate-binding protein